MPRGERLRFASALAAALLLGAALRLWNLAPQVLGGDELHAVRLAMSTPLGTILFRHTDFDHGRPLTALYRVLMDAGLVFEERTFRAPILAAGLLLLVLWPLATARAFGRGAAAAHALLLAVSPVLVLYSRIVRTYVPVALLAALALLAFWDWLCSGRRRSAWAWGAAALAAVWTHPLSAPFVLAPLAFALGERLLARRGRPLLASAKLGLGVAVALVVAHLPLWEGMLRLARTRASADRPDLGTLVGAFRMQAGSASAPFALVFAALCVVGAVRAWRRRPRLCAYLASVLVLHVACLWALGPKQADKVLVFQRYVLLGLPLVTGSAAVALGMPWASARGPRLAQALACLGCVTLALALGPLVDPDFREGSFAHHNRSVAFVEPHADESLPLPPAYAELEGPGALLEFPWNPQWNRSLAPLLYQRQHHREVVVAGRQVTAEHPRVRLRNAVPIDGDPLASFLGSRARWLVVHRDAPAEEARLRGAERAEETAASMRADGAALSRAMRERFGPPAHADEEVAIWDLDACRALAGAGGGPAAQRSGRIGR